MKNSPSSTCRCCRRLSAGFKYMAGAVLVLFLVTSSVTGETSPDTLPRKLYYYRTHHPFSHRPCDSFSHEKPRSLCNQFHRNRHGGRYLPPPRPQSQLSEIDPRYGVEKRLVPSGPNPLHN